MILLLNIMMNVLYLVLEYTLLMEEITVVISSFSLKMMKVSSKLVLDYPVTNFECISCQISLVKLCKIAFLFRNDLPDRFLLWMTGVQCTSMHNIN